MSFADKVVIVTGASSGIGAATAKLFAQEKAHVAMVGRNVERLNNVYEYIKEKTDMDPLVIVADISKDDEARSIVEKTIERFGKLDILVNNAGYISVKYIVNKQYVEDFDKVMATNLRGAVVLTNAAVEYLIETKGNIVNISSIVGSFPSPVLTAYGTAKAGLNHFSRCIALELAPKGIRVNVISPGPVKTNLNVALGLTKEQSEQAFENSSKRTPLQRVSQSEEVAELICYLASDKAKSITGVNYEIDCGVNLIGLKLMMD